MTDCKPRTRPRRSVSKRWNSKTEQLEKAFPTDEGFIQRGLRRGLRQAPTAIATPGSSALQTLTRATGAGFLGEGVKELQGPEWLQSAAEITAYIGPDITKKLLEKGSNKEIIKKAKEMGFTDEQITPLLQSENKQKWLSKLSSRGESSQEALKSTKEQLSKSYGALQKSEAAAQELNEQSSKNLFNSLSEYFSEMPASVREKIKPDFKDLLKSPVTGKSLMNFWADLNYNLGSKSKQLSLLKGPIGKALTEISPQLAQDFKFINDLSSRYYKIASRLKPTLASQLISTAEHLGVAGALGGAAVGYYPPLIAILGEKAGKKLAQQMLINPRFQQLSQKIISEVNANKFQIARETAKMFANEIKKFDDETAKKFEEISEEDLKKLFTGS